MPADDAEQTYTQARLRLGVCSRHGVPDLINFGRVTAGYYGAVPPKSLPGVGMSRIEWAFAEPDHACIGGGHFNNGFYGPGSVLLINSIEAHGFCALRISRR